MRRLACRLTVVLAWIGAGCFMLTGSAVAQENDASRSAPTKVSPEDLTADLGAAAIPDRAAFEKLSYQGPMRMDSYLSNIECVKFIIDGAMTDHAKMYWMNTNNFQAHPQFMGHVGLGGGRGGMGGRGRGGPGGEGPGGLGGGGFGGGPGGGGPGGPGMMRGAVSFMPKLKCPDGSVGLYIFDFQPQDRFRFESIKFANDMIIKTMPFVKGKLAFHPLQGNAAMVKEEKDKYEKSDVAIYRDEDAFREVGFLPMNAGVSFGRLTVMESSLLPAPRDIVICQTLPNQMPRVAGVITSVRQTPLSHVNLRAVQDKIPNAFIADAMTSTNIQPLIGKWVRYSVDRQGYNLREATIEEVDKHFESMRPREQPKLSRDLSKRDVVPLKEITFGDSQAFGVKVANVATLLSFNFPDGTVPDGFAVPFYFYDEFMTHNNLVVSIKQRIESESFQQSREVQERELAKIRAEIERATMPEWMMEKLSQVQAAFPAGTSIRCRSSTNNEDLPNFSGAGLYDSFTHKPDEGHLSKTIKEVFASLWNFRAFEERQFYRIDHFQAAMGVLMHPNFKDELANGVAVTDDVLYNTRSNYYVNIQKGEDLVTNPGEASSTEEVLLAWYKQDGDQRVRETQNGKPLLNEAQLDQLRGYLARIHGRFARLYGKSERDQFAMEIEFKLTKDGRLVIKQARPWVY